MKPIDLCKLLLDEDRLRLIGLIALEPMSQTDLMARSSIKAGVLARHLYQLQEARLIGQQRIDGVDRFVLNGERVLELKRQLFAAPAEEKPKSEEEEVLSRFVENGRLAQLPAQPGKLLIVLKWLAQEFHTGVDYPERTVNEMLDKHASDYATLRRLLIDYQFLTRSGGIYRRVEVQEE